MLKPITSGLPSGLRVSDWKMAPLTPSAAPMSSAINTRGSRHSFTTIATLRGASPNSAENTSVNRQGHRALRQPEQGNQQAGGH